MTSSPPSEPRELTFLEHLDELRARIMRMLLYWLVAGVGAWCLRGPLLEILRRPAEMGAKRIGAEELPFRIFDPAGGFMLAMLISLVTGLIAASPLILGELWGFIKPALEPHERRWVVVMIPAASGLFLSGVLFSYWVSPLFFAFLFGINQSMGVESELTLTSYLTFMLKLLLASGLCFELPLVIMFLSLVGIVKSAWLLAQWRYAIVVIAILAAAMTPSGDPMTMTIFSGPLFLLYFLSIWLVRGVERTRDRRLAREQALTAALSQPPAAGEPLACYQSLTAPAAPSPAAATAEEAGRPE